MRYPYYYNGQDYTLEPTGAIVGYVRAKTQGKAELLVQIAAKQNPIVSDEKIVQKESSSSDNEIDLDDI